ncbi:cation:proton antiporter domain-containing protein [Actinacidiphila acidipaludis]|uniref:Cation:proton antiporter n=1 Tax=Actinacidiphila acidipaludis TaxID=2873382 RepID=A0ABS7Q280_9ACTN|nr:cation:proton antiporter [Streptomyces acidipaludis]MBY8876844.1 cation:proton antiporter [Streptomyces acidipaludis]
MNSPRSLAFSSLAPNADLQLATMAAGIAVVLLTGVVLAALCKRVRQPAVIGEILAGIALGPSLLGRLPGDLPHRLFPADVRPLLSAVSQVALMLFMFMIGWEFEKRLIRPHRGMAAAVSLGSVGLAFGLGVAVSTLLYPHHDRVAGHHVPFLTFATFMGAAMSVTAFPVLARILADNRITHTRVGSLALASAAVDDLLAWCMLAYVSALAASGGSRELLQVLSLSAVYVAAMFLLVRPALAWLVARLGARGQWRDLLVVLAAGTFLSGYATTWIGIHSIFGAFLFGIVMPREPAMQLAEHLRKPLDNVSTVLLPVFFIITGLGVDIAGLHTRQWLELAAILVVACGGKLLGAMVPARILGLGRLESRALGLLMNTRGLTELIILDTAVQLGILDGQMFTMMVVMALVTTALAGPLLPRAAVLMELTHVEVPVPGLAATAPRG